MDRKLWLESFRWALSLLEAYGSLCILGTFLIRGPTVSFRWGKLSVLKLREPLYPRYFFDTGAYGKLSLGKTLGTSTTGVLREPTGVLRELTGAYRKLSLGRERRD